VSANFLLDSGGRNVGHGLFAIAAALVTFLAIAVCLPVLVLAVLFGAMLSLPTATTSLVSTVVVAPAANPVSAASVAQPQTRPSPADASNQTAPAASPAPAAVDVARRYLGVPYVFGGTNPAVGLDCSGLVQLVFHQLGISLPRTAQQQYNATSRLTQDQLQPGDLVFFARTYADPNDWVTHVGIYIGNGQQINAPTEGETVSIQPVFTGFWGAHFVGGGRATTR